MKTTDSIWEAFWLAEDEGFKKIFLIELHKYLKSKLPHNKVDEYPSACIFDHSFRDSEHYRFKHFSDFCKLQRVDPYVAHRLLRLQHGIIDCDCDYLHSMKVTEDSDDTPKRYE